MDSDLKFWALIWATFGAVIIGIAALIFTYHSAKTLQISKMVEAGANPMEASCALDHQVASVCNIWLAGQKAKN